MGKVKINSDCIFGRYNYFWPTSANYLIVRYIKSSKDWKHHPITPSTIFITQQSSGILWVLHQSLKYRYLIILRPIKDGLPKSPLAIEKPFFYSIVQMPLEVYQVVPRVDLSDLKLR